MPKARPIYPLLSKGQVGLMYYRTHGMPRVAVGDTDCDKVKNPPLGLRTTLQPHSNALGYYSSLES